MSLRDLRLQIDRLDDQLLELLEERARLVEQVAVCKRQGDAPRFHDPEREREILARLTARAGRLPREAVRTIFREVISACLALERTAR